MKWIFEMNEFCILCLNVDVKLHELSIAQAIEVENILKLKGFHFPWEDQCHQKYYVCSICLALLLKISNFMKMILNTQTILSDLSETTDTITKPMLKSIDRCVNGLNPLSVVSFGIFDNDDEKMYDNQNTHQNISVGKIIDYQVDECITNYQEYKTDCNSTSYSSDEDMTEPIMNTVLEINFIKTENDPLAAGNKVSKNNNTTDNSLVTVKQSKHKKGKYVHLDTKAAPQKIVTVVPESPYFPETESSKLSESKYKKKMHQNTNDDTNYQPDSTSHSEDSDFDSYDDMGKKIKKPKDLDSEYPKKCDHCNFEVMRKWDLYCHYVQEHPDLEYPCSRENYYACSFCGKLMGKQHLKYHEEKHNKGHYKCPKCPKVFSCSVYLTHHKNRVHGNKVFTCDYCSKSFKTKEDLGRHIRIHTGEKPFKCHICGAGFAHSGNRSIHIRNLHQNIKYAPKQRQQKKVVRKNKNKYLTDAKSESSGEQLIPKKRKRSIKQRNSKTIELEIEIEPASKKQSKERAKHTKMKLQNKSDTTRMQCVTRKQNKRIKSNNRRRVSN